MTGTDELREMADTIDREMVVVEELRGAACELHAAVARRFERVMPPEIRAASDRMRGAPIAMGERFPEAAP